MLTSSSAHSSFRQGSLGETKHPPRSGLAIPRTGCSAQSDSGLGCSQSLSVLLRTRCSAQSHSLPGQHLWRGTSSQSHSHSSRRQPLRVASPCCSHDPHSRGLGPSLGFFEGLASRVGDLLRRLNACSHEFGRCEGLSAVFFNALVVFIFHVLHEIVPL